MDLVDKRYERCPGYKQCSESGISVEVSCSDSKRVRIHSVSRILRVDIEGETPAFVHPRMKLLAFERIFDKARVDKSSKVIVTSHVVAPDNMTPHIRAVCDERTIGSIDLIPIRQKEARKCELRQHRRNYEAMNYVNGAKLHNAIMPLRICWRPVCKRPSASTTHEGLDPDPLRWPLRVHRSQCRRLLRHPCVGGEPLQAESNGAVRFTAASPSDARDQRSSGLWMNRCLFPLSPVM
jgi:hypothetical protein